MGGLRAAGTGRADSGFRRRSAAGADLLGIGREVEAFAMLVAGRDTLTPLSIGLFGGWGTGKSYFMARLEERVAALSATDTSDAYFGRIAQVRFNAWHYSEANMIASLVDQILRNLRFGPDEDEEILRERRVQVMAEMTTAEDQRRRAERELESAATSETALRDALDRVKREADEEARRKGADLAATARAIEDAQSLLQQSFITEDEARAAALRRAPAAEAASFVARTMLEDEDIQRLSRGLTQARDDARWVGLNQMNIVWGVAAITLTVLAAFSVESLKDTKLFTGLVGLVAAMTPSPPAGSPRCARCRRAAPIPGRDTRKGRSRCQEDRSGGRQRAAAARGEHRSPAGRSDGPESAARSIGGPHRRSDGGAGGRRTATPPPGKRRARGGDRGYCRQACEARRRHVGFPARRSCRGPRGERGLRREARDHRSGAHGLRAVVQANDESPDGKNRAKLERPVLDRLVLYVDDLDRCPADKVREVLRAVHLLLAFDLFVCVVAVDPRWVIQCLEENSLSSLTRKRARNWRSLAVWPLHPTTWKRFSRFQSG